MAVVRLSDAYVHDVYMSYFSVDDPERSAFLTSGIVTRNDVLDTIARDGGIQATIPFWKDIDANLEPNYSNDDPNDIAVAQKIGSGKMTARKAWLNQGFGEMDLVVELAGSSPMQHIRNRFGVYWSRQWQRRLIATCLGIYNDNVANDAGDMVVDISGNAGALAQFNSGAFIAAAYTAGDAAEQFKGIAVHSMVMARMLTNEEIVYLPDSAGGLTIPTYKGRFVIVDDMLPILSGSGANAIYLSILFGSGAFGTGLVNGSAFATGEGIPKVPVELYRDPHPGNGGGMEELWERKTWILHPFGYTWVETGAALAEFSPQLADLRLAAHWDRVVSRKQVPLAFIKSKA
jgi:hypothetical protein